MSKINFKDSSIPGIYSVNLRDRYNIEWIPDRVPKLYDAMIAAITGVLADKKSKTAGKVAVTITDLKGVLKLAGIVSYHANENEDMPGNWTYELTFNAEDIEGITEIYDMNGPEFDLCFRDCIFKMHGIRFFHKDYYRDMLYVAVDTLKEFLDVNAKEDEVVDIDFPGYFTASIGIENGEKVMSIVPGDTMKTAIKSDAIL